MPTQPQPNTVTSATPKVKPMAYHGLLNALREWKARQEPAVKVSVVTPPCSARSVW